MNSTIQQALQHLQNANYSGYFEEIDKIIPPNLRNQFTSLRMEFISGDTNWQFAQKLEDFAKLLTGNSNQSTQEITKNQFPEFESDNNNILLVASNPAGKEDLKLLDAELSYILQHCKEYNTDVLRQPNVSDLLNKFPTEREDEPMYKIVHFSGHGNQAGVYIYDLEKRKSQLIGINAFRTLFDIPDKPELVILNACYSDDLIESLRDLIPFIVTTKAAIPQGIALSFSNMFYSKLSGGKTFKQAFQEAKRSAIMNGASDDLFMFYENELTH